MGIIKYFTSAIPGVLVGFGVGTVINSIVDGGESFGKLIFGAFCLSLGMILWVINNDEHKDDDLQQIQVVSDNSVGVQIGTSSTTICPTCGTRVRADAAICPVCNHRFPQINLNQMRCPDCKSLLIDNGNSKYCLYCEKEVNFENNK